MMRPSRTRLLWSTTIVVLLATVAGAADMHTLDGVAVDPLEPGDDLVVLLFVAVECPISNRYAPEVARIWRQYAPRGVRFYLVYADEHLSAETAGRHARDYGYPFPALIDRQHRLVRHTGAEVTPQVAVLGPGRQVLYLGRIDNRYVDFGTYRPAATEHDLRNALDAALAGDMPPAASGHAIGCYIVPLASSDTH